MQRSRTWRARVLAAAGWLVSALIMAAWLFTTITMAVLAAGCSEDTSSEEMAAEEPAGSGNAMPDAAVPQGIYAERIAPILDRNCASCHGHIAPYAGLTLGPSTALAAEDILAGLIGVASAELPSMALIEPGNAGASYLYHKIADTHAELPCPATCGSPMPPAGPLLSAQDIETIQAWIQANAEVY